jgi:hypothetical protein
MCYIWVTVKNFLTFTLHSVCIAPYLQTGNLCICQNVFVSSLVWLWYLHAVSPVQFVATGSCFILTEQHQTLGPHYSGRQAQQSFYFLIPLTHYMFRPVRAIIRWMLYKCCF